MTEDNEICWVFRFAIESESGTQVPRSMPEELFEHIIDWAESRGMQVGGGYRKPRDSELIPGPIFEENGKSDKTDP